MGFVVCHALLCRIDQSIDFLYSMNRVGLVGRVELPDTDYTAGGTSHRTSPNHPSTSHPQIADAFKAGTTWTCVSMICMASCSK